MSRCADGALATRGRAGRRCERRRGLDPERRRRPDRRGTGARRGPRPAASTSPAIATIPADAIGTADLRRPRGRRGRRAAGRRGRLRRSSARAGCDGRDAAVARRRPGRPPASVLLTVTRPDPRPADRRAHRAEPALPPVRHRHAHPAVGRRGRRAPARRSATPARPRRACARWRSTRCAAAAASTTGCRCRTPRWSRTTTWPRPAASPRRSRGSARPIPDLPVEVEVDTRRAGARGDRGRRRPVLLDNMTPDDAARGASR